MSVIGSLTDARPSNLADDLRSQQMMVQIENPVVDRVFYLLLESEFAGRIVNLKGTAVGGTAYVSMTANDFAVTWSGVSGGFDVTVENHVLLPSGSTAVYEASDPDDNLFQPGQSVKVIIEVVTGATEVILDILLRRERSA